jgi:hypothetical protein
MLSDHIDALNLRPTSYYDPLYRDMKLYICFVNLFLTIVLLTHYNCGVNG